MCYVLCVMYYVFSVACYVLTVMYLRYNNVFTVYGIIQNGMYILYTYGTCDTVMLYCANMVSYRDIRPSCPAAAQALL
jgi:hypothetical protein